MSITTLYPLSPSKKTLIINRERDPTHERELPDVWRKSQLSLPDKLLIRVKRNKRLTVAAS